jgi:hypothetical protein
VTSFITPEQAQRIADLKSTNNKLRADLALATSELKVQIDKAVASKRVIALIQALRDLGTYPKPEAIQNRDGAGFTK